MINVDTPAGDARFVFDTGMPRLTLSESLARALGAEHLSDERDLYDYPRRRFYFIPYRETTVFRPAFPNIKWRYDGGRVVAASVWDENIRGIAPGDRIVSVDGVPCGKISLCDYIGLRVRDGSALEVETRDGTRRTVIAKAVPRRL